MSCDILVIDDEQAIRDAFVFALDTLYSVETADSGEKGVELFQSLRPRLVFTDLKMPGINGAEVVREIRKQDMDVPIYIVTAFHNDFLEQLQQMAQAGIHFELLNKPVGHEQILLVASNLLGKPEKDNNTQPSPSAPAYVIKLYVAGSGPQAQALIDEVRQISDKALPKNYVFHIIDVLQDPQQAIDQALTATPTLIKQLPLPIQEMIGKLSKANILKLLKIES